MGSSGYVCPLAEKMGLWQASLMPTSPQKQVGSCVCGPAHLLGLPHRHTPELSACCSACHFMIPQFPDLGDQHSPPHPLTPCSQHALFQTGLWADRQHVCRFSTAILVHSGCEFSPKAHLPGFRSPRAYGNGMERGCWIEPSGNSEYLVGRTGCEKAKLPVSSRKPWEGF